MKHFLIALLLATAIACPRVAAAAVPGDSTATDASAVPDSVVAPPPLRLASLTPPPFGVVTRDALVRRHAYSLDHFLQSDPAFVLVRRGTIGSDVALSRFGMGRGRAVVLLDGIPINDPQNDIAPLVHTPVGGIGALAVGERAAGGGLSRSTAIEGLVRIDDRMPPLEKPSTFLDLSKGTNQLRQRRVRFSSAQSAIGLDLGYDELLNDGYNFDARQLVGRGVAGYGGTRSRYYTMGLRGVHPLGESYSVDFGRFTSSVAGDLTSPYNEERRSGHLASARTSLGRFGVTFYERGYDSTYPDSQTVNQTTAAHGSLALLTGETRSLVVEAGVEDIQATERVGGAESRPSVMRSSASVEGVVRLPGGVGVRLTASGSDHHDVVSQWGGGVEVDGVWKYARVGGVVRRSYRMPNLGELYLPAHDHGGVTVSGNKYLDAEYAVESGANATLTLGRVTNDVRFTLLHVTDPVAPLARTVGGAPYVTPRNGDAVTMHFVEDRVRVDLSFRGIEFVCEGSGVVSDGDRFGYFASTPRTRTTASVRVGGNLFNGSSALYAGADYLHQDERADYEGNMLPAYEVLDLSLDGRLIDAHMYIAFLNVLDARYRTDGDYLMTPRTFVYGIAWTLWE